MRQFGILLLCLSPIWATPLGDSRIVKGEPAVDGEFPWMAAIYYSTSSTTSFCGGALVSDSWVLTSAHSVYGANNFTIYLGSNSLVTNDPRRVIVQTSSYLVHPSYTPGDLTNDVGLINLNGPVTLSDYIKPIELDYKFLHPGTPAVIAGWGATSGGSNSLSPELHYITLVAISNTECLYYYAGLGYQLVCAVGLGQSICNGDTGGALVTYEENGEPRHAGITTFISSSGCDSPYPSGFTRSHLYKIWVETTIGIRNATV